MQILLISLQYRGITNILTYLLSSHMPPLVLLLLSILLGIAIDALLMQSRQSISLLEILKSELFLTTLDSVVVLSVTDCHVSQSHHMFCM